MATLFWDAKGVILLDILPQGQCINAARYCSTLDCLKEAIRRKRPGLLRRGVVLQHDNATPHSANLTQQWLQRYGWEILVDFFRMGINSLLSRWQKCIDLHGDYVEK
ncbi:histone-lysine N-methyltransferase SETMAR [Plakobranchus ocellatus]|uniref:Histone-lysine N-methyltransferase SETMAR n=1 Tax=Plakobranchus ocellatus TaxID=259542 RepID=A0AAV3ZA11_9GAST|nr:histone-lysine N-methyltransferase SETMAR [Plakobranchus ocellatus]